MQSKAEIISRLTNPGIIAIVRALRSEQVVPLSEALVAGGIIAVEITLTTPNAIEAIRAASRHFGLRALIGVGTILTPYDCQQALDAGAQFVVTPICRPEFVALTHHANKPVMLGAYTPTEAQLAHEAGAEVAWPATIGPVVRSSARSTAMPVGTGRLGDEKSGTASIGGDCGGRHAGTR